jgi:hypothetical protein
MERVNLHHESHVPLGLEIVLKEIFLGREELLLHESVHVFFEFPHLIIDSHLVGEIVL